MSEAPRDVVIAFFEDLNSGDFETAFDRIAPDVDFWIAGRDWSVGGEYDRAGVQGVVGTKVMPALSGPLHVEILGVTAENERVAVETNTTGQLKAGGDYGNRMHMLFEVRGGKIVKVREYHDTLHASRVLCP